MTDFKIPDEAVEAALFCTPIDADGDEKAMPIDYLKMGTPEQLGQAKMIMRAALEAALPVMFEEAIWQFQGSDGEWYGFHNEKHKRDTEDSLAWPMRQLFVIKEPK